MVKLTHCKRHNVNYKRGGSYIDSTDWIKNKKPTINPKNEDNICFKYEATFTMIYKEVKNNPERASNIKPFLNCQILNRIFRKG